jgi:hypothetical protein
MENELFTVDNLLLIQIRTSIEPKELKLHKF